MYVSRDNNILNKKCNLILLFRWKYYLHYNHIVYYHSYIKPDRILTCLSINKLYNVFII